MTIQRSSSQWLLSRHLLIDPTTIPTIIKSRKEAFAEDDRVHTADSTIHDNEDYQVSASMLIIEISDLVRRSFLLSAPKCNQRLRLKIFKALHTHQDALKNDPVLKEFIVIYKDDTVEEIMYYNEILDHIQSQDDQDKIEWRFKCITSHESPFHRNHTNYNGSL